MMTLERLVQHGKDAGSINERDATALRFHSRITEFLDNFEMTGIAKLPSLWRSSNIVLRISTSGGDFAFKYINDIEAAREVDHVASLRKSYIGFLPKVYCREGQAYLMEFVPGVDFFTAAKTADRNDIGDLLRRGGHSIGDVLNKYRLERAPASGIAQIGKTLDHYSAKSEKSGTASPAIANALRAGIQQWREPLEKYDGQTSHNDLNAANVIFCPDGAARAIDPEFDSTGINDPARDIGRYAASIYFNTYDYFGNNPALAERHLRSFLAGVNAAFARADRQTWARTAFYIGQSAIAFANFNAKTPGIQPQYYAAGAVILARPWKEHSSADEVAARVHAAFTAARGSDHASTAL